MGTFIQVADVTHKQEPFWETELIQGLPSAGPCFPLHRHYFSTVMSTLYHFSVNHFNYS